MNAQSEAPFSHLLNRELRHVEASKLTKLSEIIDKAKAWNRLIEELTKPEPICSKEFGTLPSLHLSLEAISIIKKQFYCGRSPTLTLLNHWSITGRRRPTVACLLGYLLLCDLKQAAQCVCQSILGLESLDQLLWQLGKEYSFSNLQDLVNSLESSCSRYSFKSIYQSTKAFCNRPYDAQVREGGAKIGEGRFSSVYRAEIQSNGKKQVIAAKLLKSECNMKYLVNEIDLIAKVRNENILQLLGIAIGEGASGLPEYICLIYHYIENGSLLDCLSGGLRTRESTYLSWLERIIIAVNVADGISYLHTYDEKPVIHRDIKTANIFIDVDLRPKIGDFSLLRQLDVTKTTQYSQNVMGTSVYMPPEAFRGDLSIKFDTFSFGVVLLELLTGLKPFNADLDEDLLTYVNVRLSEIEDECAQVDKRESHECDARDVFLKENLDEKAGNCNFDTLRLLFRIALRATESNKKSRPEMVTVAKELKYLETH